MVEYNEDYRVIYGTMLRAHGFVVQEAEGGEVAIQMAKAAPPNLVLMDIGLPMMDGVEATRLLKQDPVTAKIPVPALTAHALLAERQWEVPAGVDGYLVKLIACSALVREVVQALRRAQERYNKSDSIEP